jgi:hypothetical protein
MMALDIRAKCIRATTLPVPLLVCVAMRTGRPIGSDGALRSNASSALVVVDDGVLEVASNSAILVDGRHREEWTAYSLAIDDTGQSAAACVRYWRISRKWQTLGLVAVVVQV